MRLRHWREPRAGRPSRRRSRPPSRSRGSCPKPLGRPNPPPRPPAPPVVAETAPPFAAAQRAPAAPGGTASAPPPPPPAAVALSDDDGAADTATLSRAEPVLTETMAELYLRQGHEEEALHVYEALLAKRPTG